VSQSYVPKRFRLSHRPDWQQGLTAELAIYKAEDSELLATGEFTAVISDVEMRRPVPVPDKLRAAIANYEGTG
jgi:acyl-CoA thioesterase FadM